MQLAKGCTPDLVMPRWRLAVFVDGCYWHGCPVHGRKVPFSGPNALLWEEKMRRNAVRDTRANTLAEGAGWRVLRLWECDVMRDSAAAAHAVLKAREARASECD